MKYQLGDIVLNTTGERSFRVLAFDALKGRYKLETLGQAESFWVDARLLDNKSNKKLNKKLNKKYLVKRYKSLYFD